MLKKLVSYDFTSLFKALLPSYIVLGIITIVTMLMGFLMSYITPLKYVFPLTVTVFIITVIIVLVYTFFVSIKHFYQDFAMNRGYLIQTLPVSKSSLIFSKILTSLITMLVSGIVILVCISLLLWSQGSLGTVIESLLDFPKALVNMNGIIFYLIIFIMLGCSYLVQLLMFFLSIALGQMRNTNKLIGSVVAWLLLYVAYEVVAVLTIIMIALFVPNLEIIVSTNVGLFISIMASIYASLVIVFAIVSFVSIKYIFTKKINLE
ncbi:MAG: hypothetical protein RR406_04205 [Bacilli bacterium]